MNKVNGFVIVMDDGQLGYDRYTYFTTDRNTADSILIDVRDEFPELRIVPAVLQYESPEESK
jgi:hypothetical protein